MSTRGDIRRPICNRCARKQNSYPIISLPPTPTSSPSPSPITFHQNVSRNSPRHHPLGPTVPHRTSRRATTLSTSPSRPLHPRSIPTAPTPTTGQGHPSCGACGPAARYVSGRAGSGKCAWMAGKSSAPRPSRTSGYRLARVTKPGPMSTCGGGTGLPPKGMMCRQPLKRGGRWSLCQSLWVLTRRVLQGEA